MAALTGRGGLPEQSCQTSAYNWSAIARGVQHYFSLLNVTIPCFVGWMRAQLSPETCSSIKNKMKKSS